MLTDTVEYIMTILPDEQIQLRRDRVILDNGHAINRIHHRQVLEPGHDVSAFPERVRAVCMTLWTPAVIQAYRDTQAKNSILL